MPSMLCRWCLLYWIRLCGRCHVLKWYMHNYIANWHAYTCTFFSANNFADVLSDCVRTRRYSRAYCGSHKETHSSFDCPNCCADKATHCPNSVANCSAQRFADGASDGCSVP